LISFSTEGFQDNNELKDPVCGILADANAELAHCGLKLCRNESGLSLVGDQMVLCADLSHMAFRVKPSKLCHELLVRAARIKGADGPLTAIDATAGLGEDALLLAAAGFHVILYENNPVVAALLIDSLLRARKIPELVDPLSRMKVIEADSIDMLPQLASAPDVIYLDPMFPSRTKSAAVKKKFQLLHQIEKPCGNSESLMQAAMSATPRKIVIKRPLKGPYLAKIKPSYSLKGKSVRFDVLVL
jgi:16S rRNA (guanine1516-N2)-methyltransferase